MTGERERTQMSEAALQSALIKSLRSAGANVERFTDMFKAGIPDLIISYGVFGVWLELKWNPAPDPFKPLLPGNLIKPHQIAWLKAWHLKPLPCAVMVGFPGGWVLVPISQIDHLIKQNLALIYLLVHNTPVSKILPSSLIAAIKREI
jgi:hypothetical protein